MDNFGSDRATLVLGQDAIAMQSKVILPTLLPKPSYSIEIIINGVLVNRLPLTEFSYYLFIFLQGRKYANVCHQGCGTTLNCT
jgi:hypothetical protein